MFKLLVINIMMAIFSLYIIKIYFAISLEETHILLVKIYASIAYIITQVVLAMLEKSSPSVLLAISIITILIFCFISYSGKFTTKIISAILLLFLWMAIEVLVFYVFEGYGIAYQSVETAGSIISKLIMIVLIKLIKANINYKANQVLSRKTSLCLLCIPIGSIYIVHNIFKASSLIEDSYTFPIISSLLILAMNCGIFIVLDKMVEEQVLRRNQMLFIQQMELYEKQVQEREHSAREIRRVHHDLKAHFVTLKVEIENNKVEQALEHINKVLETGSQTKDSVCKSGNLLIDVLINYKYVLAHKNKIKFTVFCEIPSVILIKNSSLSIILGNILDNAIEANEKVLISDRFIDLSLIYSKGCLTIILKNAFCGILKRNRDGDFLSTKREDKSQGIGMSSIKKVIEACEGEMIIVVEDNVFITTIMLYDEE